MQRHRRSGCAGHWRPMPQPVQAAGGSLQARERHTGTLITCACREIQHRMLLFCCPTPHLFIPPVQLRSPAAATTPAPIAAISTVCAEGVRQAWPCIARIASCRYLLPTWQCLLPSPNCCRQLFAAGRRLPHVLQAPNLPCHPRPSHPAPLGHLRPSRPVPLGHLALAHPPHVRPRPGDRPRPGQNCRLLVPHPADRPRPQRAGSQDAAEPTASYVLASQLQSSCHIAYHTIHMSTTCLLKPCSSKHTLQCSSEGGPAPCGGMLLQDGCAKHTACEPTTMRLVRSQAFSCVVGVHGPLA